MKVIVEGVHNINKGAELMFCAICQEMEQRFPGSTVVMARDDMKSPYKSQVINIVNIKRTKIQQFLLEHKIAGLCRRLGLGCLANRITYGDAIDSDILFNAGGYWIGDVWNHSLSKNISLKSRLSSLKKIGMKVVCLPQAIGPLNKKVSQQAAKILVKNAMVFAREDDSYKWLSKLNIALNNVRIFPDFTPTVDGKISDNLLKYKDAILIIPNIRMKMERGVEVSDYVTLIQEIQAQAPKNNQIVLLNHEGNTDLQLCNDINKQLDSKLDIITNLDTFSTKGLISIAYAVISSRFHGTANALSNAVPSISSSWSSKYEMLYKDYNQSDMIVNLKNADDIKVKLTKILDENNNKEMRAFLLNEKQHISNKIHEMWNIIFNEDDK